MMKELLIGQVPLFASLPRHEIQHLAEALRECEFPANALLFNEGENADRFFILLDGQIEIIKALGTPDERLLAVREPGSFIGEMSLFSRDGRRTASVRSRTPLQLLEMSRAEFDALLHRQPSLAYEMVRVLSMRLNESENATIRDLQEKNRQLTQAYEELKAAHEQIVEKEELERELAVAREIQQSILPRVLPRLAGFDFGVRMVPTRAVGGDFFDFIPLGDEQLGIAVGDVSDKGVPAAIFMALTRSLLRAEAVRAHSPREALRNVNRHLLDMNDAGMFVTVLYGVLSGATQEFDYVRAGHELPLVFNAQGSWMVPARQPGQPLGLIAEPALDEQRLAIRSSSTLMIYTDGISEAMNAQGELFGLERLREVVRANRHRSAQSVCDQLFEAVSAYRAAAPQFDDITLVCVRAVASG